MLTNSGQWKFVFFASLVFNFSGHCGKILTEDTGNLLVVLLKTLGEVFW